MTLRRFKVGVFRFIRRPVSEPPPEGMICFADNGDENGWSDRAGSVLTDGKWTNGKGQPLRFEPTYWIELEGMRK